MIQPERIQLLNDHAAVAGDYVLYWMQAAERTQFNHALEHAIDEANRLNLPVVVCFGLMDDFPEANLRHYTFLLEGLADVKAALAKREIKFVIRHGGSAEAALHYGKKAAMIVCDRGYTRHQKSWRDHCADAARCPVVQVETDVVVPVEVTSDKHEFAARTIRPRIHKHWDEFLVPVKPGKVKRSSMSLDVKGDLDPDDIPGCLKKMKIDRSVPPTKRFTGGEVAAQKSFKAFLSDRLSNYKEGRNEPANLGSSFMSPHLHFGHVSPVDLVLAVRGQKSASTVDIETYVEELVIRRELSMNFVNFEPNYDSYEALPEWARKTLSEHRRDKRDPSYTRQQLEAAETDDPYWNAAQQEMVKTGFMHNYMRMYWGKKILEWTPDPAEAFDINLRMNNKYLLDGRDPNSFANVSWIYGMHDRPWGPRRKIFGLVRYMNAGGLKRKFDMAAYVKWVDELEG